MEANKKLMQATMKLGQFQRLMISPKNEARAPILKDIEE